METWKALSGGTARCSTGTATSAKARKTPSASQRFAVERGEDADSQRLAHGRSQLLDEAALEGEDALRTLLDEDDDGDEDDDLGDHRAGPAFQQLAEDAEAEGGPDCAGELPDAADHHDHERIDDIALAHVRPDVGNLRQRHAAQPGDAGAEREGHGVDARVGTPTQPAMARFWVTARTNMPSRVLFISTQTRSRTNSAKPTMMMRFHGRIRFGSSAMPPDIQLGLATSTFCAPKTHARPWIRTSEMPQVASRVSSVRPYSQRITVRSITTPTSAAAKKATGMAAGRYQSM